MTPTRAQRERKRKTIAADVTARLSLRRRMAALTPAEKRRVYLGTWSVRELVAHLIGWDYANMEAIRALSRGRLPKFYAYKDHDWQTYNARLVKRYGKGPMASLLRRERDSHAQLLKALEAVPDDTFAADMGVRYRGFTVTVQRLIQADATDTRTHARQISAAFD